MPGRSRHSAEGAAMIRAHSILAAEPPAPLGVLTMVEAARELRCSRAHIYNILRGEVEGLPPLPVFHMGRTARIRMNQLQAWVRSLEDRERENRYSSGNFGIRDEDLELFAGA
jgi:hypothetical protein